MRVFVLTGGGSLGAVHVGMLKALYERGITPDLIIGSSVGAINGLYLASRPSTTTTVEELGDLWRGLRRRDIFPLDLVAGFLGFTGRNNHLVPNRGLRRIVESHSTIEDVSQAPIPLLVITTDATSGEEVPISSGNAVEAVLASAAIPGVFPPIEWQDRLLIDGGVANYAPISHAIEAGADEIYVLTSGTACDLEHPPQGAIPLLLHSMSLVIMRRLVVEVSMLDGQANIIVLPPPCPLNVAPHDFGKASTLIRTSYETTDGFLDAYSAGLALPMPEHLARLGVHHPH